MAVPRHLRRRRLTLCAGGMRLELAGRFDARVFAGNQGLSMTIRFLCPMGHPLAVPDNRAGKKGRCPVCRQRVVVPRPPGGAALSDDEVANLLAEPTDDEEDDSDSADFADDVVTGSDPVEAPPGDSGSKPPPDARS